MEPKLANFLFGEGPQAQRCEEHCGCPHAGSANVCGGLS